MSKQIKKLELTLKSILIGVILAIVMCGANIYLGLKIGITISASIPAAIMSLGMLRLFKNYSILENSIAQTLASVGEVIAVPIIFVFPALLMIGAWHDFSYLQILLLGLCGSFIGIAYSVLLRKILINDKSLPFPEGNAIAKVLIATNNKNSHTGGVGIIFKAILASGLISFCQNGLKVLASNYYKFTQVGKMVIGLGVSFSPALVGAGFLIGSNMVLGLIGLILGWLVLLPIFTLHYGLKDTHDIVASGFYTWSNYVRPVGIGVFLFSGVATIILLAKPITSALKEALFALSHIEEMHEDRDLDIKKQLLLVIACIIPIGFFVYFQLEDVVVVSKIVLMGYAFIACIIMLVLGFVLSAISGYMVGLVGSSNSPMSGLLFIAVIILSVLAKFIMIKAGLSNKICEVVIMVVGFSAFSAAIINDNVQDYKSGQLVGSTPYKQQIALYIGAVASILIAPIMADFIFHAYGIAGVPAPHVGMDPHNMLNAPQASAIAMVVKNIIGGNNNYSGMLIGVGVGFITFIADIIGKKTGKFTAPVVMVGAGLYLPPELIITMFIGGALSMIIKRRHKKLALQISEARVHELDEKTNVLVCGLIAGESLMGLILAVPFVLEKSSDALRIVSDSFIQTSQVLGSLVMLGILVTIYRVASNIKTK